MGGAKPETAVVAPFEVPVRVPQSLPTVQEFLAEEFPEPIQLLGPVYNENIVHIAAAAGTGKTQLAVAMAWQMVHGDTLWHWGCPARRSVLFVDGEMPGRRLQDRFRMYRWLEQGEVFRVMNAVSWASRRGLPHPNLAEPYWQEQFLMWADDLEVLIFDNVMSLVSVPGESMSSDQFWKPIYDFNLRVRAAGKTVVWLDHANQAGKTFGTKTKEWPADLVLTLSHGGAESEGAVGHLNADPTAPCEFAMEFGKTRGLHGDDVASCTLKLMTGRDGFATWSHVFTEEQLAVRACLLKEEGLSIRQISGELGVPRSTVQRWIAKASS